MTSSDFISDKQAECLAKALSRRALLGGSAAVAGVLAAPLQARADAAISGDEEITVDQAQTAPIPIALPSFGPGLGEQITAVISADLANTGLFSVLPGMPGTPDFPALKAAGARAAVSGSTSGTDGLRVEMRLWNVLTGQQMQGTAYSASAANWRSIAHIIADVIYERMLGEKGCAPQWRKGRRTARIDVDASQFHLESRQQNRITLKCMTQAAAHGGKRRERCSYGHQVVKVERFAISGIDFRHDKAETMLG